MTRFLYRHRMDLSAAAVGVILLMWAVSLAGCTGITVAGVPDTSTTLRGETKASTENATTARLAASVAVGTVNGEVVTLQEGTPVSLPPGSRVTLPAGTPVKIGGLEALIWIALSVAVVVGGAFAIRWAWRRFTPKETPNADD